MRKTHKLKQWLIGLCLLGFNSANTTSQSLIGIQEIEQMSFGILPSGIKKCSLSNTGSLTGGCVGAGNLGEMLVTGEPYYSFNMSVSTHGWQNGLKLNPRIPPQNLSFDSNGQAIVKINGYIQTKGNISATGQLGMTYTLTVNYQ